ncbi:MAG: hypothetical protein HZA46_01475 [Planctomycetales bacterium]|nr:hypothetical protein [Planctomycetales bacterium]
MTFDDIFIHFSCQTCQRKLKAKQSLTGKIVKCPNCSSKVAVPQQRTASASTTTSSSSHEMLLRALKSSDFKERGSAIDMAAKIRSLELDDAFIDAVDRHGIISPTAANALAALGKRAKNSVPALLRTVRIAGKCPHESIVHALDCIEGGAWRNSNDNEKVNEEALFLIRHAQERMRVRGDPDDIHVALTEAVQLPGIPWDLWATALLLRAQLCTSFGRANFANEDYSRVLAAEHVSEQFKAQARVALAR